MSTVAELRRVLQEDSGGNNLYEHLVSVLAKLMLDKPSNAFENFELISAQLKSEPPSIASNVGQPRIATKEEVDRQSLWTKKCSTLLKIPDEPAEELPVTVPDLMDLSQLYEWANISLGTGLQYRMLLSIRNFAKNLPGECEQVRFFGRINTQRLPYYVLECTNPEEEEANPALQEGKDGGNRFVYYVTTDPEGADWIKLPMLTMNQIVIARKIKRILSGDLAAPVSSFPPFPGNESNLLRAQIARIVGATSISPDGYFEADEDTGAEKVAEAESITERFPRPASELTDMGGWKHHVRDMNVIGRVTALPEELDEGGEPIEQEEVELPEVLAGLKENVWSFRTCPGGAGAAAGSVVVARSLEWPGAVAIAAGRRYVNVYVGNGIEFIANSYSPPLPQTVQTEWTANAEDAPEGEEGAVPACCLIEEEDPRVDPTPPVAEGEEEDE